MASLDDLIRQKNKRLESVPGKLVSGILQTQKQILQQITDLLARFDLDSDGKFKVSKSNMELAGQMDVLLREILDASEYNEFITEFASEFNTQVKFNERYFRQAFPGFESSEIGALVVRQSQANAVTLLVSSSPDADFIQPIKQAIETAVVNNASFTETVKAIRLITVGDDVKDGKILQYSKQIAHDSFAVADRSYSAAVAEQVGADWYKWSGNELKSTRPFCEERKGRYFCKREIQAWGDGIKTSSDLEWPQGGSWAGEWLGTNSATIFSVGGGYGCVDSVMAVSVFNVPIDQVKRAIDLGLWEPSEFEAKELGL